MYRLASVYHQEEDMEMASQTLTLIAGSEEAPDPLKQKALMQNGRMLERLGDGCAARSCYELLLELFPQSEHAERAREALANI